MNYKPLVKMALKKFKKNAERDFPQYPGLKALSYIIVRDAPDKEWQGEGIMEYEAGEAREKLKPEHIKGLRAMIPYNDKFYAPKIISSITLALDWTVHTISFHLIFTDGTDKLNSF